MKLAASPGLRDAIISTARAISPSTASPCTVPAGTYVLAGIAVADKAVIQAGVVISARAFTTARQTTVFQAVGAAFDPAKAQVFVHVDGTPRAVSIAAAHATTQAVAATTWTAGDTGHDVFFPNVDIGGGTTTVSVAGGAVGTGAIPLVAGTITNVTVIAN